MRSVPSKPTVSLIISIRKQERLIQTKFTINYTTLYLAFNGQKTQNSFLANYSTKKYKLKPIDDQYLLSYQQFSPKKFTSMCKLHRGIRL